MRMPRWLSGLSRSRGSGDSWTWLVLTSLARAYLTVLLTLVCVGTLSAIGTWETYLVHSGSMAPSIGSGDLVVTSPLGSEEPVPMGRVVSFRSPASPSSPHGKMIIHRVVSRNSDGSYVTAGDANRTVDTAPLDRDSVTGRGRLLVPFVGLPVVWWNEHDYVRLLLWAALSMAAVALAAGPAGQRKDAGTGGAGGDPASAGGHPPDSEPDAGGHRVAARTAAPSVGVVLLSLLLTLAPTAEGGFSDETRNPGNDWAMTSRSLFPYTAAVLTDSPWAYYVLDEPEGPVMTDSSGNSGRSGTYVAPLWFLQNGALTTQTSYAVTLAGAGARAVAATGSSTPGPTTFSLELWFKTTTTTGGKLIGFEDSTAAASGTADRHIFMRNDGRLSFGGWSGASGGTFILTTPAAYNDGAWHHLVVTTRRSGITTQSVVYVDGISRATGRSSNYLAYAGYWRLGYGALPTGSGYPSSANFAGTIDNAAVYLSQLSAARVAAHYAAR